MKPTIERRIRLVSIVDNGEKIFLPLGGNKIYIPIKNIKNLKIDEESQIVEFEDGLCKYKLLKVFSKNWIETFKKIERKIS